MAREARKGRLSALIALTVALYPLSHLGFRDALQALLKSFDIAVEQYARVSGTHWYDLELTATDNLTLERMSCRCPVVGTWKNGFIVLHQGQPRAVGKSEAHHNLLPVAARLIRVNTPTRETRTRALPAWAWGLGGAVLGAGLITVLNNIHFRRLCQQNSVFLADGFGRRNQDWRADTGQTQGFFTLRLEGFLKMLLETPQQAGDVLVQEIAAKHGLALQ